MSYPSAQQFREDHNELISIRDKYKRYFKELFENDPNRMSTLTIHSQDIGYALDRLVWIHEDFEKYISNRQPLTRGSTENGTVPI